MDFIYRTGEEACAPIAFVRHTAGLTLLPERSSNGDGTRTPLYRIAEWLAIGGCVDILGRIGEKRESIAGSCCPQPGTLGIRIGRGRKQRHHEAGVGGQVARLIENNSLAVEMGLQRYSRHENAPYLAFRSMASLIRSSPTTQKDEPNDGATSAAIPYGAQLRV
jgi:hypothetical protein